VNTIFIDEPKIRRQFILKRAAIGKNLKELPIAFGNRVAINEQPTILNTSGCQRFSNQGLHAQARLLSKKGQQSDPSTIKEMAH
jgi:hypothetical protein